MGQVVVPEVELVARHGVVAGGRVGGQHAERLVRRPLSHGVQAQGRFGRAREADRVALVDAEEHPVPPRGDHPQGQIEVVGRDGDRVNDQLDGVGVRGHFGKIEVTENHGFEVTLSRKAQQIRARLLICSYFSFFFFFGRDISFAHNLRQLEPVENAYSPRTQRRRAYEDGEEITPNC